MRLLPLWTAATPVWGEDAEEGSKSVHSLAAMHEAVNSTDKSHNIGSRWRYANAKRPMQPVALLVGGDAHVRMSCVGLQDGGRPKTRLDGRSAHAPRGPAMLVRTLIDRYIVARDGPPRVANHLGRPTRDGPRTRTVGGVMGCVKTHSTTETRRGRVGGRIVTTCSLETRSVPC